MSRYQALTQYCRKQTLSTFDLPFNKIEALIGGKLPDSALRPQFWANTVGKGSPVREALRQTAYDTFLVNGSRRVTFRRR
jgi:hypothetical protein